MTINTITVFAESERDSKWIYDKKGTIIYDNGGSPLLRTKLHFENNGIEVFDADGNSLGKFDLKKSDLYANGEDLALDFPVEVTENIAQNNNETNKPKNTQNTTDTTNKNNTRVIKVTIGSKIANINGENIQIDVSPYIQQSSNSTMIPLRFVANALNIDDNDIKFEPSTKTIIINIKKDNVIIETIKFFVNSPNYSFNGYMTYPENVPIVEIKDGRTFVPLRTLAEAFKTVERNVEVDWDTKTKTATMKFEQLQNQTNQQTETNISAME